MSAHQVLLKEHGVAYAGPDTLRTGGPARGALGRFLGPAPLSTKVDAAVREAQLLGAQRLIVSEENLLGSLSGNLQNLYPSPQKRIRPVAAALKGLDATVLLSIRGYAGFLTSIYAHTLRNGSWIAFDDIRTKVLSITRRWPDVVRDVMQALPPGTGLKLWRFEDFEALERHLLEEFAGPAAGRQIKSATFRQLSGPSEPAIARLAELAATGHPLGAETVLATYGDFRKAHGHPAFDPWSGPAKECLNARYTEDIADIDARWPGALLRV